MIGSSQTYVTAMQTTHIIKVFHAFTLGDSIKPLWVDALPLVSQNFFQKVRRLIIIIITSF